MRTLIVSVIALVGALCGLIGYQLATPPASFGSVSQTNGYAYTQLTGAVATTSQIMSGRGMLGSVIITEDQAGAVVLWDATSTAAVGNGLATRVVDFQNAETEGTYTFDTNLTYGLVFVSDDGFSFAGDWTVTYRQGW